MTLSNKVFKTLLILNGIVFAVMIIDDGHVHTRSRIQVAVYLFLSVASLLLATTMREKQKSKPTFVQLEELSDAERAQVRYPQLKKGNPFWITVGFIMSFLGGMWGILMGANYAWGWFGDRDYDDNTRKKGREMFYFGIVMIFVWFIFFGLVLLME